MYSSKGKKKVSEERHAHRNAQNSDQAQENQEDGSSSNKKLSAIVAAYESLLEKKDTIQTELVSSNKSANKLQEENQRLKQDQGEILGEMQKYKKKMIECDINLATATDLYTILKNKLEEATREVAASQNELHDKQSKIEDLEYKLEASKKETKRKVAQGDKLMHEKEEQAKKINEYAESLERKQNELSEIQRQNVRLRMSETALHEATMENDRIQLEQKSLERTLKDLRGVAKGLQLERDSKERELSTLQDRYETSLKTNEKLAATGDELKQHLGASNDKCNQYHADLEEMRFKESKLRSQLEEATKTCEELINLRVVISSMQKRVDNAFKDLELKDEVIDKLRKEKDDLRRECENYINELQCYKVSQQKTIDENDRLNEELNTSKHEIIYLNSSIKNLKEENGQLKEEMTKYQARVQKLNETIQSHKAQESILNDEISLGKSTIFNLQKEVKTLKEENASLIRNIETYDSRNESLNKEVAESCTQMYELKATIQRQNDELKKESASIRQLEEQLSNSQDAVTNLKSQLSDSKRSNKASTESYNHSKKELDSLQKKYEKLEREDNEKDKIVEQLRKELSQVCNDALEAESDLASSKMTAQRGKEEIEDLLKNVGNLKKKNLQLEEQLRENKDDNNKLQSLVSSMRSQASNVETELDKIQRKFEVEARSNKSKLAELESAVDMSYKARDLVVGQLETEKCLSQKYKDEFKRIQQEYLEHQHTSEKYNTLIIERDHIINGLNKQICGLEAELEVVKNQTTKGQSSRTSDSNAIETMLTKEIKELERKNELCKRRTTQLECEIKSVRLELEGSEKENKSLKQKINDFVLVFVDPSEKEK